MRTDNKDNGLYIYEAFSEAKPEYVDEMLSDSTAENIRRQNRKRTFRLHSAMAACAAVLAVVVGLSVIPRQNLQSGDNTHNITDKSTNVYSTDDIAEDEMLENQTEFGINAQDDKNYNDRLDFQDEATADAEITQDTALTAAEPETPTEEMQEDNITNDIIGSDGFTSAENSEGTNQTDLAPEILTLSDGRQYIFGTPLTQKDFGNPIEQGDDYMAYSFGNFSSDVFICIYMENKICLGIRYDAPPPENLGELFKALGMRYYLHCNGAGVGEVSFEYTDEKFQKEIWDCVFDDPYNAPLVSAENETENDCLVFNCRLGTDIDTYIGDITLTIYPDGIAKFTILDKEYAFDIGENAQKAIDIYHSMN